MAGGQPRDRGADHARRSAGRAGRQARRTARAGLAPCATGCLSSTRWRSEGSRETRPVAGFAAALMRKDPPVDANFHTALQLLGLAELGGARIYNRPQA
ncbi:MAG: hypothetical protein EB131_09075, partial [Betaproteobacteria bacterium]|nr:hypothetical protein [Betaproteobacteria bacterium]